MSYLPGSLYYKVFTTANPSTGAAANADSLPVATANRNGNDDVNFVLTVTNLDTGRYKITGTIPSGYVAGDVVNVTVAATCASVPGKEPVDFFFVGPEGADVVRVNHIGVVGAGTSGNPWGPA